MSSALQAVSLRCEHLENPLGIDVARPQLSWALQGDGRGRRQCAYRIVVANDPDDFAFETRLRWDSGRIDTGECFGIHYAGPGLKSCERVWWSVRVWDEQGQSVMSDAAIWEAGILDPAEWQSDWITAPLAPRGLRAPGREDSFEDIGWLRTEIGSSPVTYFRRELRLDKPLRRARAYATALGLYRLYINGTRADDRAFAPGWTDYHQRTEYQSYDITDHLRDGENVLAVTLAEGWYAGYVGFTPRRRGAHYGNRPYFLAHVLLEFEDGTRSIVATDGSWQVTLGPIRYSDLLKGELYDARRELSGWHTPGYDGANCFPAEIGPDRGGALVAERAQAMKIVEEVKPVSVTPTSTRSYVFDLGQNMVGHVRLRLQAASGTTVKIRHAEALHEDGSLYTENLRTATAEDTYVCKGQGIETYEPSFTYHGFRYVELSGLDAPPDLGALTGRVLMSAVPRTGTFRCSSPLVNQLYSNIVWSQKGNFISVPTDCPQRDERLGWLGDAQVFASTAAYNMDVSAFFTKWMFDVADAQLPDGAITDVAPLLLFENGGAPGWAEAGIIIPWTLYLHYGDSAVIDRHWNTMVAWMDYVARHNPTGLRQNALNLNFGDWLAIGSDAPRDLIATAFYAYSARLMADMAGILGRSDEQDEYSMLWSRIRGAFVEAFVDDDGAVAGETQTGFALALAFDLLPDNLRPVAATRLVENLEAHDWRMTTGFLGVKWLLPVLSRFGFSDVAYKLLLGEAFPSWGFCIRQGATTMWERWDSWTPEHGFQEEMNSFNHYAFGSVGEWLYGYLGGIRPDPHRAGFQHVIVAPEIQAGIGWCDTEYLSRVGRFAVAWKQSDDGKIVQVTIPPNATATVHLPAGKKELVSESGSDLDSATGVVSSKEQDGQVVVEIESGEFVFNIQNCMRKNA